MTSPVGHYVVLPPSVPGASILRIRILANVPRIITSWFPRRDPYELKCLGETPLSCKYCPAGTFIPIAPDGEIWSVVIESPKLARALKLFKGSIDSGSFDNPSKNGGF